MEIKQEHAFVSELLSAVQAGRLFPAAFQRLYVWGKQDVEAMWDSILEGFPLGAFFVWNPQGAHDLEAVARGRLGPIQAEGGRATGVILDGQNRLATFAWSLAETLNVTPDALSAHERETWMSGQRLVADYAQRRILFVPEEEAETGVRVPAWVACRGSNMMRYLLSHYDRLADDPDVLRWLDECGHRTASARIIVTNANGASLEEAQSAFLRICRVGVPMSEQDFRAAVEWSPSDSASGPH